MARGFILPTRSAASRWTGATAKAHLPAIRSGKHNGNQMEMHQVRYFLAVAQELNFTRAAEHCHVAQPSLTRAIKLLEDEFGGALFHRERSRTHLSELGQMVYPFLKQVHDQAQLVRQQAINFTQIGDSTLKFGIMC